MNFHLEFVDIFKAIVSLFTTFISGFVGAYFALNKFKKEKFWDERRSSYKTVIESMEELLHWCEQVRADHYGEPSNTIEAKPEEALRQITKLTTTGRLIFERKFSERLKEITRLINSKEFELHNESLGDMETEKDRAEWRLTRANEIRKILEENLPELIEIARQELPKKT